MKSIDSKFFFTKFFLRSQPFRWKSVKSKLVLGFSVVLLTSAVSGYLSMSFLSDMNRQMVELAYHSSQKVLLADQLKEGLLAVELAEKKFILSKTSAEKDIQSQILTHEIAAINQDVKLLRGLSLEDDELSSRLDQFEIIWHSYFEVHQSVVFHSSKNSNVEAKRLAKQKSLPAYTASYSHLDDMLYDAKDLTEDRYDDADTALYNAKLSNELHRQILLISREKRRYILASNSKDRSMVKASILAADENISKLINRLKSSRGNSSPLIESFIFQWQEYRKTTDFTGGTFKFSNDMKAAKPQLQLLEDNLRNLSAYNAKIRASSKDAVSQAASYSDRLEELQIMLFSLQLNERELLASDDETAMLAILERSKAIKDQSIGLFGSLQNLAPSPELQSLLDYFSAVLELHFSVAEINIENSNTTAFNLSTDKGAPLALEAGALLNQVVEYSNESMKTDVASMESNYVTARYITIFLLFTSLIGGVAMASWISISISKGLGRLVRVARLVRDEGDFSYRSDITTADEIGSVARAVDSLLDKLQGSITGANSVLDAVANGDFSQRLNSDVKGDLATLQIGVNKSAASVDMTMKALEEVMVSMASFDFSVRMNHQVKGKLRVLVDNSMEQMESAVSDVQEVMSQVAKGRFDARIKTDLTGGMELLKNSINLSLDELERALHETSDVMAKQASGDLMTQVKGLFGGTLNDLKVALNNSSNNLLNTMSEVATTAGSVTNMATQIAQASEDLSNRTQSQASSLEETAASMEEMSATVAENSLHANQAKEFTQGALESANASVTVGDHAITSMRNISDSSRKMADIIDLIDSIAFQTNLLALNAAVEAARAGEQGRGFAVVAGEVRLLAQKTAEASKEIKQLINLSLGHIDEGAEYVNQAGETMKETNTTLHQVSDYVAQIATASEEQRSAIQQVSAAVINMDSLTQQNSTIVDETASASRALNQQAQKLMRQIDKFKLSE